MMPRLLGMDLCITLFLTTSLATLSHTLDNPKNSAEDSKCSNKTAILEGIFANSKYNRMEIPGGPGLSVTVQTWIQDISASSSKWGEFAVDLYMSETWRDPGLQFDHLNPCNMNLTLNSEAVEKYGSIWNPNLSFINSKSALVHSTPLPNDFTLIYSNGTVWKNYRLQLKGPCDMNFAHYPFDVNRCHLTFESYLYNRDEVDVTWAREIPVILLRDLRLIEYFIEKVDATEVVAMYPAGYWNELTITIALRRNFCWYIIQAYTPAFLAVLTSWVHFYLGLRAVTARSVICLSALLAMFGLYCTIASNGPRVGYIKSIDSFMLTCLVFVFCALVELGLVSHLTRDAKNTDHGDNEALLAKNRRRSSIRFLNPTCSGRSVNTANRIDLAAAVLFPFIFAVFNILYWYTVAAYTAGKE